MEQTEATMTSNLFEGLSIKLEFWSETFNDLHGKPFIDGALLHGEAAYLYLVAAMDSDKKLFSKYTSFHSTDDFIFTYRHGEDELVLNSEAAASKYNLQSLVFGNKKSVIEGLQFMFPTQTNAKKNIVEVFAVEEAVYCKEHPDIKKMNEQQVELYQYAVDKTMVAEVMEHETDGYWNVVRDINEEDFLIGVELEENPQQSDVSRVVLQTNTPPAYISQKLRDNIQIVLSAKEKAAKELLDALELKVHSYGTVLRPRKEPKISVYRGTDTILKYFELRHSDGVANAANHNIPIMRNERLSFELLDRGKPILKVPIAEIGSGTFLQMMPKDFRDIAAPSNKKEFEKAEVFCCKYTGRSYLMDDEFEILPPGKIARAQEVVREDVFSTTNNELKPLAYAYLKLAGVDLKLKEPDEIRMAAVKAMIQDGLSDMKIKAISKALDKDIIAQGDFEFDRRLDPIQGTESNIVTLNDFLKSPEIKKFRKQCSHKAMVR